MNPLAVVAIALLGPMFGVALCNLLFAPRLRRARALYAFPRVSLLVPARNEEHNLREHLPGYLASDYPNLEILILDDDSTDATVAVVEHFLPRRRRVRAGRNPTGEEPVLTEFSLKESGGEEVSASTSRLSRPGHHLDLIPGRPLPAGWVGKSWACQQLADAATGDVLIFCDADVDVDPAAITATVGAMRDWHADVLTSFPRHRFDDWLTASVVPVVAHLPVGALLPLPLVDSTAIPSISVGNGQWLAFTREAYDRSGGHRAVRGAVIEDVALARRAKEASLRVLPTLAADLLAVRMYRSFSEASEGFAKNIFQLAGGRAWSFLTVVGVLSVVGLYPLVGVAMGHSGAGVALALMIGVRTCVALTFRHGVIPILLHPVGTLLVLWIAGRSFTGSRRGTLRWKGRNLPGPAH
jgi:chlorobactene glucosyltransferase